MPQLTDAPPERAPSRPPFVAPPHTDHDRRAPSAALDIAAQSAFDSQVHTTSVDRLVAERALDHHWEGLFQHAVVQVGTELATEALEELATEERERDPEQLEGSTTSRARLYRALRTKLAALRMPRLSATSTLWWASRDATLRRHAVRLRSELTDDQRDVLELRFARGLSQAEVADVLERDVTEVGEIEARAKAHVEERLGRSPHSFDHTLQGALLEMFALQPGRVSAPPRPCRTALLQVGDVVSGRYEVEALLGAGAFADVYRVRDLEVSDHVVALKMLRQQAMDARAIEVSMREVQLIASVFHPSVVQLKEHGWHDGRLWFVMPLYRGETLRERLARGGLERAEARRIFEPLAEALATMHRAGVLHQDIKPDNVFLAYLDPEHDGRDAAQAVLPVLLDLGVAAKNAELVLAGTPAYLAPEVAARFAGLPDPPIVGPKADVFSLALTLLEALSPNGTEQVPGGTVDAFIAHRARRAPTAPAADGLDDLRPCFERWLSFSPDARPSAEELRKELALLTRPDERRERRKSMLRTVAPTALAVVTVFGAAVLHLSREASQQRSEATQARREVQHVSRTLQKQQTERMALEQDVERLRGQYQESRMTRDQLAARLGETEGRLQAEVESLRRSLAASETESERVRKEAQDTDVERQQLDDRLGRLGRQLDAERARVREAQAEARGLRNDLRVHEAALREKSTLLRRAQAQARALADDSPRLMRMDDSPVARASTLP